LNPFSRKELVLNIANKQGSAHLDLEWFEKIYKAATENIAGWQTFSGTLSESQYQDFKNRIGLSCIRQIRCQRSTFPSIYLSPTQFHHHLHRAQYNILELF
jgi:hypothetical protein